MPERRIDPSDPAFDDAMAVGETELPIRYTVPFEWGTIRVTESAHEAYSLTPLKEGVQKGDVDPEARPGYVDVRIISPGEVPESSQGENSGLHIFTQLHEERLGVQAGFNRRTAEDLDHARGLLRGILDLDEEGFAEMTEDLERSTEELPVDLADQQQMSQLLIHALSESIHRPVINAYSDIERNAANRKVLEEATQYGAIPLAAAGTGAIIAGPNAAAEAVMALYAATGLWIARRHMKRYFDGASEREQRTAAEATVLAQAVSDGIHETYCLAHFDYENRWKLED